MVRFNLDGPLSRRAGVRTRPAYYPVEVNLDKRSRGFRWFFSFYITFAADTQGGACCGAVLLLDEPGLHLHQKSQEDLLRHLQNDYPNQIIYTTHSPFMLPPEQRADRPRRSRSRRKPERRSERASRATKPMPRSSRSGGGSCGRRRRRLIESGHAPRSQREPSLSHPCIRQTFPRCRTAASASCSPAPARSAPSWRRNRSPKMRAKNLAAATLSRAGTMV